MKIRSCIAYWLLLLSSSCLAQPAQPESQLMGFIKDEGLDVGEIMVGEKWQPTQLRSIINLLNSLPNELKPRNIFPKNRIPITVHLIHTAIKMQHNEKNDNELTIILSDATENPSLQNQLLHYLLHKYDEKTKQSREPKWRNISGWSRPLFGLTLTAQNQDLRAYATTAGLKNPTEDFVTLAQHYILPPDSSKEDSIKCRTPRKYAFMSTIFPDFRSPIDQLEIRCTDKSVGLLDDMVYFDPNSGKSITLGPINSDTVQGFELLYATPGTADAAEIAGHLLLRIKLNNNPAAQVNGIENPYDLVISFLADTKQQSQTENHVIQIKKDCDKNWFNTDNDNQSPLDAWYSILQSLKGLGGGFLTIMDRQTLAQTIKNYTIEEDRNLLRYRLNLSDTQQQRLLEHLYRVKKNYKTKYYFFNQNCASVLVKIIGQGIGDKKIAEFSPLVSPPNSLVALLIREGLATPTRPAFLSYRKKGLLAQELLKQHYDKLKIQFPLQRWPTLSPLFSKNEKTRLKIVHALTHLAKSSTDLAFSISSLMNLIQEAEMVYAHKDLECENYTSSVTAHVREFQRGYLLASINNKLDFSVPPASTISDREIRMDEHSYNQGESHTKLFAYSTGFGYYQSRHISQPSFVLNGTLDQQEMGSISNVAMQRGNYIKLGSMDSSFALTGEDENQLQTWHFTALDIRKFKERLNRIPGFFSAAGSLGLGLSLIDFNGDKNLQLTHGTWLGGELLFNLHSSAEHNNYAYVSIGADLHRHHSPSYNATGVVIPARIETLMSSTNRRQWQWRNKLEYRCATSDKLDNEIELQSELSYKMGHLNKSLVLVKLSTSFAKTFSNPDKGGEYSQFSWLGLEINHL